MRTTVGAMEPSESALRVLSTMFDTDGGDSDERLGGAQSIGATRPAEDCGCQHVTKRPLKQRQF